MVFIILFILIIFLAFPLEIAFATKDALNMCLNSVIPSLFPFMAVSKMLVMTGNGEKRNPLLKIIARIFKISQAGVTAFLLGLVCGYPVGAKIIAELLKNKKITMSEAKRLMLFSNNAGPAFTIATVGGMFFLSIKTGVIIYASHILSSIIIGIATSFFGNCEIKTKKEILKNPPFYKIFISSIADSVISVLNVSGIIIFFSALCHVFDIIKLTSFMPTAFESIFKGLFEITTGIKALSLTNLPHILKASFSSFLISFSGLSVLAQIKTFANDMKITPVIITKLLSALLSMVICYFILRFDCF